MINKFLVPEYKLESIVTSEGLSYSDELEEAEEEADVRAFDQNDEIGSDEEDETVHVVLSNCIDDINPLIPRRSVRNIHKNAPVIKTDKAIAQLLENDSFLID